MSETDLLFLAYGSDEATLDDLYKFCEKLESEVRKFKVFGTDECKECLDKFGHAPVGSNYNRVTLFYKPSEHDNHKQKLGE